jgi:hypothetical protein
MLLDAVCIMHWACCQVLLFIKDMSYVSDAQESHMVSLSQSGYSHSLPSMQEMELLHSGTINFSQDSGMHSMGFGLQREGYGLGMGDGAC